MKLHKVRTVLRYCKNSWGYADFVLKQTQNIAPLTSGFRETGSISVLI